MKTYDETFRSVLRKRDEVLTQKQNRTRALKKTLVPAVCALTVLLAGVGLWKSGVLNRGKATLPPETVSGETTPAIDRETVSAIGKGGLAAPGGDTNVTGGNLQNAPEYETTANAASEDGPISVVTGTTQPSQDETGTSVPNGGDGYGYFCIPALLTREIVTVGEKITDEEAAAYFADDRGHLIASLSSSGVPTENLRVSDKGYCHVCYAGVEGEKLEVRENFRDYLVYNGDSLVAIVTLSKENGTLYSTPSFGAAWFDDYNAFLNGHRGEELVYVYAGFAEIILTPDGGMYAPLPAIVPEWYMQGIEDPYHVFYHPGDVYVP